MTCTARAGRGVVLSDGPTADTSTSPWRATGGSRSVQCTSSIWAASLQGTCSDVTWLCRKLRPLTWHTSCNSSVPVQTTDLTLSRGLDALRQPLCVSTISRLCAGGRQLLILMHSIKRLPLCRQPGRRAVLAARHPSAPAAISRLWDQADAGDGQLLIAMPPCVPLRAAATPPGLRGGCRYRGHSQRQSEGSAGRSVHQSHAQKLAPGEQTLCPPASACAVLSAPCHFTGPLEGCLWPGLRADLCCRTCTVGAGMQSPA